MGNIGHHVGARKSGGHEGETGKQWKEELFHGDKQDV
jgi:hypothetical protein